MKTYTVLTIALLLLTSLAATAQTNSIVPGRSIGAVRLGEDMQQVTRRLGDGKGVEAAMGHFIQCWLSTSATPSGKMPRELDIYSVRNADGDKIFVNEIRVNSATFHTPSGIHTGSSLERILAAYPHIHQLRLNTFDDRCAVYDAISQGIAFEFDRNADGGADLTHCTAILVHPKNRAVNATYSPLAGRPFGPEGVSQ